MTLFSEIKRGMATFGKTVAMVVNSALLFVVYIIGVGLTSITSRIIGKKFLDMKLGKKSYWKKIEREDADSNYRQF